MKRLLPKLILLGFSLTLGWALAEVVLRTSFGAPPAWTYPQEAYVRDPEVGHRLAPGQRAFTHHHPLEINSMGLRDREFTRARPPGTRRLLALGDSQTFGDGLALVDTWPKLLERELNDSPHPMQWEVLNAGLSGAATWQHEILLERWADVYELDGVVLGFYVNDVLPEFAGRDDSAGERTNTFSKRAGYLLKRSAVFTAALQGRFAIRAWLAGEEDSWEQRILTGAPDPQIEAGWQQVARSLGAMKAFADEHDLEFWVVALPRRDQFSGAQKARAYQGRLQTIVSELGVPLIDVLPSLEVSYARHGDALTIPWDGHNSALANAEIASEVARAIGESSGR